MFRRLMQKAHRIEDTCCAQDSREACICQMRYWSYAYLGPTRAKREGECKAYPKTSICIAIFVWWLVTIGVQEQHPQGGESQMGTRGTTRGGRAGAGGTFAPPILRRYKDDIMKEKEKKGRNRNTPSHSRAQKHRARPCPQDAATVLPQRWDEREIKEDTPVTMQKTREPVTVTLSRTAGVGRERQLYGERSTAESAESSAESGEAHGMFDDACAYEWLIIESHGALRGW
ncbi:hypothetical protein B0H13DRAFT_1861510 [Mycena leptocephala]|nr:hypothetical protein B0H13DRAFT_1861510 [Mycena leptocephala]